MFTRHISLLNGHGDSASSLEWDFRNHTPAIPVVHLVLTFLRVDSDLILSSANFALQSQYFGA
jgi:hypothetical protein